VQVERLADLIPGAARRCPVKIEEPLSWHDEFKSVTVARRVNTTYRRGRKVCGAEKCVRTAEVLQEGPPGRRSLLLGVIEGHQGVRKYGLDR
jgi:hypothetical protein